MPRVRRGPGGPKGSLAGKSGTNKRTKHKGAGTSGFGHLRSMFPRTRGKYGGSSY